MAGLGHIGELQVIEYLEKDGHAIYLPMKDKGIDFIAIKNNATNFIQVKTSKFQKNSYFWFDLYKRKMVYTENTTYIFVLYTLPRRKLMGKAKNYLVIPSLKIKEWVSKGLLPFKQGTKNTINFFVYPDFENLKWAFRNKGKEIDLTKYWNNFKILNI
ncbi:MAG: hypothetical protein ISS45_08545 [Candidatus Omnitrophica bacterium]|nr:hypothetical protein [Candidatus Omnitrophota bacterium]